MSSDEKQKKRLREYLNPTIVGKNVDIVLDSLSSGAAHLIENVEAVNDMLYIVTSKERYLDDLMAGRDITRPDNVGLSDEVYREIGIEVTNRKQVRDLVHNILEIMYSQENTRATSSSQKLEPYQLEDLDNLIISYDDTEEVEVVFKSSQFTNISSATAQEVADAITRNIKELGRTGAAIVKDDGIGSYVTLISETIGPSSTVKVLGGKSQNKLKFDLIRPTSGEISTQWTLTQVSGGRIRATWSGGPTPSIGRVSKGDYVNIYGTSFDEVNRGTFNIIVAQGGLLNQSYVEYENPIGIPETAIQGDLEAVLFFNPTRKTIISKKTFAAAYQTESRLLEVFIPATTKVIRRSRAGASHVHETGSSGDNDIGPYIYDVSKPYIVGEEECNTVEKVDSNTELIIQVDDSSEIPDEIGNLVFGLGTSKEEGPIPYIARPSSNSLYLDPTYKFKFVHESGTNISLISINSTYDVTKDGTDYPDYVTDIVSGRLYAEELINLVVATGIIVVITVLYPNPIGLENWERTEEDQQTWKKVWN